MSKQFVAAMFSVMVSVLFLSPAICYGQDLSLNCVLNGQNVVEHKDFWFHPARVRGSGIWESISVVFSETALTWTEVGSVGLSEKYRVEWHNTIDRTTGQWSLTTTGFGKATDFVSIGIQLGQCEVAQKRF